LAARRCDTLARVLPAGPWRSDIHAVLLAVAMGALVGRETGEVNTKLFPAWLRFAKAASIH
jgi:hypothetical protein